MSARLNYERCPNCNAIKTSGTGMATHRRKIHGVVGATV